MSSHTRSNDDFPATPLDSSWRVLLIGGSSGLGKSTAARQIARRFNASTLQCDDVRMALQRVTTSADQPALHFFVSQPGVAKPDVWQQPAETLLRGLIGVAEVVSRALEPIIGHHCTAADPIVVEGDVIVPALARRAGCESQHAHADLKAVFLVEPDENAVRAAMVGRGTEPEQWAQARMYWLYGQWLRREAERYDLPVIEPRPWPTLVERILAMLR